MTHAFLAKVSLLFLITGCTLTSNVRLNFLKELQIAYDVNSKMNSVCVYCEGEGSVKVYHGYYEDRGTWETCKRCGGSGVEPKKENDC